MRKWACVCVCSVVYACEYIIIETLTNLQLFLFKTFQVYMNHVVCVLDNIIFVHLMSTTTTRKKYKDEDVASPATV